MIVGIDISEAWLDAAWRQAGSLHTQRFEYTEAGLRALQRQAPAGAQFVMEATGVYHTRLALSLLTAGCKVSVVNPLVIKRYGQMQLARVKSDRADAQLIMHYGEQQRPALWQPPSEQVQELQQAHGWLQDMLVEHTRLLNRQQAQAHRVRVSRFVRRQMADERTRLEARIKACEVYLEGVAKKAFGRLYTSLQTIPSIGPRTALELIIVTGGFTRFDDVKALSAYVGVSPTTFSSGRSVRGHGGIAKLGQGRLRQLLYVCSWTAKRCNPSCAKLWQRLKAKGKPSMVVCIAIAHKLLRQAFAVATKGTDFSPEIA